jgi:hypothetical protein
VARESCCCKLIFQNVTFFRLSPRDEAYPQSKDLCDFSISKVIPNTTDYSYQNQWADGEEFNLLFEFQSERALEVGAESVENGVGVLNALRPTKPCS